MTVAVALVCEDGSLLASDSMGTSGLLATTLTKVHSCGSFPLAWTWAGSSYVGQQVGRALNEAARNRDAKKWSKQDPHVAAEQFVDCIRDAVRESVKPLLPPKDDGRRHEAEFLVAGHTTGPFVAHVKDDLAWELEVGDRLLAIGSGHTFAAVTRALMHHYIAGGLTLEKAKVIAYRVIETVCDVSAYGVSIPVQMAIVDSAGASVVDRDEIEAVEMSVERWKELERDTLRGDFEDKPGRDHLMNLQDVPKLEQP